MKRFLLSYIIPALAATPLFLVGTGCKSTSGDSGGGIPSIYGADPGRLAPFGASTDASISTVNRPVNGGGVDKEMSAAAAALRGMDNIKPLEPNAPIAIPTPPSVEPPAVDPVGEVDAAAAAVEAAKSATNTPLPTDPVLRDLVESEVGETASIENPAAAATAAVSDGFTGMESVNSPEGFQEIIQEVDPVTGDVIAEYQMGSDGIPIDASGTPLNLEGYEVQSVSGAGPENWSQPVFRGDEAIQGEVIPEAPGAFSGGFGDSYAIPGSELIGPLP